VVFAAGFAAIRGIRAGIFASFGSFGERSVDQGSVPIDLVGGVEFNEQEGVQLPPNAGLVPDLEVVTTGFAAATAEFGRQVVPGDARLENEEDAGQDLAIVQVFATGKAETAWRRRRQQGLQPFSECVGEERDHDTSSGWSAVVSGGNVQLLSCQMNHFFRTL